MTRVREQVTGCKETFTEMAGDNLFGVANSGQVDAGVPAKKHIDVHRYLLPLTGGQGRRFVDPLGVATGIPLGYDWYSDWYSKKRFEQLGDSNRVHT
jgi:hypothetical protein